MSLRNLSLFNAVLNRKFTQKIRILNYLSYYPPPHTHTHTHIKKGRTGSRDRGGQGEREERKGRRKEMKTVPDGPTHHEFCHPNVFSKDERIGRSTRDSIAPHCLPPLRPRETDSTSVTLWSEVRPGLNHTFHIIYSH